MFRRMNIKDWRQFSDIDIEFISIGQERQTLYSEKYWELTLRRLIASLKEKGKIKREGSNKFGCWIVVSMS